MPKVKTPLKGLVSVRVISWFIDLVLSLMSLSRRGGFWTLKPLVRTLIPL